MKIKHITLFTAFALAAFAFAPSARAVGDNGDIRGIHAVSPDVLFPNEGEKMGHDSPLSIGQKVYILVRMLNEDWEDTYNGSTPHPWYFKPTGFGSTNTTAVALGISVGSRPDVATYSDFGPDFRRSGVNPDVPYYTDFYFVYTVKANDLGLPIELVDKTGAKVQDNNGFYLLNVRTDGNGETFAPFMLVNDSTAEQHLANFVYGPDDLRTDEIPEGPDYPAYPGKQNYDSPLDKPGPHRSYTLAQEEVFVQTIDFDHVNSAGEPWSKGEVWRVVQQGSAEKRSGDLWPTITSKGGATVYVWSEDNAKAYVVPYGEGQEYVDETRKVLKVSLDAGSSSFKIYGAGAVGDTVDIFLSSQPFEQVTKLGDVLDYNVCRRTVQITEPPKPSIEITTRNAQGIDVSKIDELEALANPEENVIELKVSITKPYSATESLEIDLAAVFTNGTGAAVADSPTNGYIRILSEPDDPREAPNALPRVTIGPNETSATVFLYALGSCSLPAERKSDPNAKRVVINPVLVDPSAAEVFTGGLSGFEIKKLSDQAPEILGPAEGETFTVREGSQMDVPVLLSDNWRDLQEAYNTNGYKVAWTFTSGGVSGETNRVAFAEDTSVSVYPTAPNRDSDMIVKVTDPAGNVAMRTVHVNVTPKPKAEVRFYTDATRQTRYLGDFLEHAQDTPYYLDIAFVDGSEAPADMWAFLEPLDANATNLVVCSAVSNGIEIVQGRTNSQYAVAIGVLDGFSPMNPMTARFNVLFRSAPEIGDTTATDYTDDCGRPSVTVRAVNVAPEVPYVKVDTDKILDGDTLAQTIPSGLAVQFKAKLSDLSEKDLAVDDGAKAIWTLWEYTDNFDGYEAGGGRTVMVTNGLQSFATCPITFHYEDTVQRIRVYALDKDERNGETDPDKLDALWGDPKLTLYVKVAATPTVQIVQKVNGQMVVLTAEDEMLFMEDKMKSTAGDFYVQLSDKPGDSAAGEIGITKDNPIAVQIVLEKYGDGNVDVNTNYVYFTSSADVSAKPVKLNVDTLNGGRETLYAVSATVVRNENMHDQYGSTWDEHFFPATTSLRVLNVPPVINTVKRTNGTWSETGTNTCSVGEAIHLSWKVTDITNDFTRTSEHEFTLTWSIDPPSGYVNPQIITNGWKITSSGGTKGYVTGEYEFIIPAVSGYSKVELRVNDGDSENDVLKEWWYYVAPTKPLEINVFGPSATGKSKYKAAKGRGMGLVGVKGTTVAPLAEQFVQTWTFAESAADASVYAWGYPATNTWHEFWNYDTTKPHYATLDMGNVPGDLGHSATGVALNKYGSKYGTGDEYFDWSTRGGRDEDAGRYDSFFYRWVITKAAGGGEASAETLLPAPTAWSLDPSGETIPLDDGGDKGVYGKVVLEAVFARELREKDNLGDINADGIPDKIVETFGLGAGSIGTFPEDDLADLKDLNDDEDILPAMDTSVYGTFIPGLKESWATWGTPFTARREIRGEHEGLNDAPKQPVIGLVDYRLEPGYNDDDLERRIAARDYSEVEMMAWADHGYAKDWTPECPSDPTKEDTDDDGMPDGYEYYFWYRAHVGYIDADGAHKYLVGRRYEPTHPAEPTEILPGEIERIMNPQVPYADGDPVKARDTDNDGLPDLIELEIGTNPFDYDTDGDGLPDGYEVIISCTDPLLAATDMRVNDGTKNPDGDTMAVYETAMQVVGVWNAKKSAVEYYCCAPSDDTNLVFQISDVTNTYTRITCLSASALKAIGGVTNVYVTTAPVQVHTNAEGVVSLVGGLSSENTWIVAGDGFRGRPSDVLAGTVITKDPETEVEIGEKTLAASTNAPPVYYKAWVRDISTDKEGKQVKTFVRGREYSAAKGPFAKEGAQVVDFWKSAKVLVQHFYVYQEHGFDPRTAWKRPPAPPECVETVNFTTLDELYLQTFFYHADLLTDADLTPTLRVGWATLWPKFCTSPVHCDTDEDGIPDGWELYILTGPKAYDKDGNPVIGYHYNDDFSPLTPTVDPQPTADGDKLSAQQEFSGTHSVAEYDNESYYKTAEYAGDGEVATLVPAAVTVKLDNELWTNKQWPTDPWNADTDDDGVADNAEGEAFLHNGGLNPLSWDTDKDGLPDQFELEFAGTWTVGGGTNGAPAAAGWTWNNDGMDGTTPDARLDYDHDGLCNWQEYMVGAVRAFRYDDTVSPWGMLVDDSAMCPEPRDKAAWGEFWGRRLFDPYAGEHNMRFVSGIFDGAQPYFSLATNKFEQAGVFGNYYMFRDGVYHDLSRPDPRYLVGDTQFNRFTYRVIMGNPSDRTSPYQGDPLPVYSIFRPDGTTPIYPTKYICCDPRMADTDGDGMDDFYEMFHGLNPLLAMAGAEGDGRDVVFESYGGVRVLPWTADNNYWIDVMWLAGEPRVKPDSEGAYDFFCFPWLAGLQRADPDGDNIPNFQEAIMPCLQAASTYLHTDPTPLWMTDTFYEKSLTRRYYIPGVSGNRIGPFDAEGFDGTFTYVDPLTGEERTFDFSTWPWLHFEVIPPEEEGGMAMLFITWEYDFNAKFGVAGYHFSFEENEGYDSDHDYLDDYGEAEAKTKAASDPQNHDSPLRRQAMWFGGKDDPGFLQTPLPIEELVPVVEAGSEPRQNFLYYTVECWTKADAESLAEDGQVRVLVERATANDSMGPADERLLRKNFQIGVLNGRWYTKFDSTGTDMNRAVEITEGPEATTNWTHVAASYDGHALKLYVNGSPVFSKPTSIQPEHGVEAILLTRNGEIGLDVEAIHPASMRTYWTFLIGASAADALGVCFDYNQFSPLVMTTINDYTGFYKGYIDEVRVWDGARPDSDIKSDYDNRVRYDAKLAQANRSKVFASWALGGSRVDAAVEKLPAELMFHWAFDHIPGAIVKDDVMKSPTGFSTAANVTDSRAIWSRPADWYNHWFDYIHESIRSTAYYNDYDRPTWTPWIADTVHHLPRFDLTTLDSVYWSENYAGDQFAGAAAAEQGQSYMSFLFPRTAEVFSQWVQQAYDGAHSNPSETEDTRWNLVNASSNANDIAVYRFARRNRLTLGADLLPFGGAYARRISSAEGGLWDNPEGEAPTASDAWAQTGSDVDNNNLPDWWESYARVHYGKKLGKGVKINWDTILDYEGIPLTAGQAYLRDLARGMVRRDGKKVEILDVYADVRDLDRDGMYDWWEDLYGIDTGHASDAIADPDNDGLSNYQEYLVAERDKHYQIRPDLARSLSGQTETDYFLPMPEGHGHDGEYLGEVYADHDFMEDQLEDDLGTDRTLYDAYSDNDEDGWSAWSELRYSTFKATRAARFVSHIVGDEEVKDFPIPVIHATLRYNGAKTLASSNATIVVEAYSGNNLQKAPNAYYYITPGMTVERTLYLGSYEDRVVHGTLTPGFVKAGIDLVSLQCAFIQPDDIFSWMYSDVAGMPVTGTYEQMYAAYQQNWDTMILATQPFEWADVINPDNGLRALQLTYDEVTQTGHFLFMNERVGKIDYRTGDFDLDISKLRDWYMVSGVSFRQMFFRLQYTVTVPALQNRALSVSLANPDVGNLTEGTTAFAAYMDLDGDGYTPDVDPIGFAKGVSIGWDGVPELVIEMTDKSQACGASFGYDEADEMIRVVRTSVNGKTEGVKHRIVFSRNHALPATTDRRYVYDGDLLTTGAFGLDWANLATDLSQMEGISESDVVSVGYTVVRGTESIVSIPESSIVTEFTVGYTPASVQATPYSPSASVLPIVETQRPTFKWSASEGYTAFRLQISDAAGKQVYLSDLQKMPPRDASKRYFWTAPVFIGDVRSTNDTWQIANNSNYSWRVAMYNPKFRTTEWSDPAAFRTQLAEANDFSTIYGSAKANVRYFGPATNELGDVIVQLFRNADFAGVPAAQARLPRTDGRVASLTNGQTVAFHGLANGDYYACAFIDRNGDCVRQKYETWGYSANVGKGLDAIWTPVAVTVDAGLAKVGTVTLYMEDTDVNQDGVVDVFNDESVLKSSDTEVDTTTANDTDGDGMPDKWEEENGLNPYDPSDAENAIDGDMMAFLDLEVCLVQIGRADGSTADWYALPEYRSEPSLVPGSLETKKGYFNPQTPATDLFHTVSTWKNGSAYGLGTNVTFAATNGLVVLDSKIGTVRLVHAQVYAKKGFSSKTAVAVEDAVDTKPFTALDKYLVGAYFNAIGVGEYKDLHLNPNEADSDGDGLPDGWELYVMYGKTWDDLLGGVTKADSLKISPLDRADAMRLAPGEGSRLRLFEEYDAGFLPTDPWTLDSNGDGVSDYFDYHWGFKGDSAGKDFDGDGLSNYAEYLITEVFRYAQLDPRNPKTDGSCVDYFRKMGDLYFGEIFTDHDQVDDVWEGSYPAAANRYVYDPPRDDDKDGWSNYAEAKAGTDPTSDSKIGIEGYVQADYPVPSIEAFLSYQGAGVVTAPVVIQAWSQKEDPQMTSAPDAVWTVGAQNATDGGTNAQGGNGETGGAVSEKYVGIRPNGTRTFHLGPGAIEHGSVKILYKDLSYCQAKIDAQYTITDMRIGRSEDASWYYTAQDREGVIYTVGGIFADEQAVGTVNYETGEVTIDFNAQYMTGQMLGDPGSVASDSANGGGNAGQGGEDGWYDLLNLDESYVVINWKSCTTLGSLNRKLYLSDADARSATGGFGHLREGLNTFLAFADTVEEDGKYTPGEPFGVVRDVDVGWDGAKLEIKLTDTSAITPRINPWTDESDRVSTVDSALVGNALKDPLVKAAFGTNTAAYAEYEAVLSNRTALVNPPDEGERTRVRVVRYGIDDMFCYRAGVYGDQYEQRTVLDRDFNPNGRDFLCEADFLGDGQFDIDWDYLRDEVVNASGVTGAGLEVSNMTYLVVIGDGPTSFRGRWDTNTAVNALATMVTRRFEVTRHVPVAENVEGVVYGARPTFRWSIPDEEPWAKAFGTSYTAFKLQILKEDGTTVVYDSDVRRLPPQAKDGSFTWTADAFVGDTIGAAGQWKWRVAMYNAKFKPMASRSEKWSNVVPFATAAGTQQETDDHNYSSIDVSVKYTGPALVLSSAGFVRVQAFETADFSGTPAAQISITDISSVKDATDIRKNGTLVGLKSGTYYVRAYIDSNKNGVKDDWESWGAAKDAVIVKPNQLAPIAGLYIEDADTDQDWIPDAYEYLHPDKYEIGRSDASVDPEGRIILKKEVYDGLTNGVAGISRFLSGASLTLFENFEAAGLLLGIGGETEKSTIDAIRRKVEKNIDPNSVKITSLTVDAANGKVVLTVAAKATDSIAGQLLLPVYTIPESTDVQIKVYRKANLATEGWGEPVKVVPVTVTSAVDERIEVELPGIDFNSGFYKVEIVQ